jgi:hypothetical protein
VVVAVAVAYLLAPKGQVTSASLYSFSAPFAYTDAGVDWPLFATCRRVGSTRSFRCVPTHVTHTPHPSHKLAFLTVSEPELRAMALTDRAVLLCDGRVSEDVFRCEPWSGELRRRSVPTAFYAPRSLEAES